MTFTAVKAKIANHVHNPGDATVIGECLVMALRSFRAETPEWGGGTVDFVTENGVSSYPLGSWPLLPGGLLDFSVNPLASHAAVAGAILEPDTLVSAVNLTGDITDVQDSAEAPDENYLDPTAVGNTSFEVRWDVALSRPLLPGSGKQVMRVACYGEGTNRIVAWTVKEGGATVSTGTFTVNSTSPTAYHVEWDAALLSTLDPAANQISLLIEDSTGFGDVHFGAVQWFTHGRLTDSAVGGMRELIRVRQQKVRELLGGRIEISIAQPTQYAIWNNRIYLFPTPNGAYLIRGDYDSDSTRDSTTGALITESSTTETNQWLDGPGYQELLAKTLQIYYRLRPHDAKAAALADEVFQMGQDSDALASDLAAFSGPPAGYL